MICILRIKLKCYICLLNAEPVTFSFSWYWASLSPAVDILDIEKKALELQKM